MAEVTNPGQNESQQIFALCDWVKEIVVRTNRLTKERGSMIGQNPKAEVAPSFVGGNRDKEISFEDRFRREQMDESRAGLRAKKLNRDFLDSS